MFLTILLSIVLSFDSLYEAAVQASDDHQYALSVRYMEQAIDGLHPDSLYCFSDAYNQLTNSFWLMGQHHQALHYAEMALRVDEQIGEPARIAQSHAFLAAVFDHQGQYDQAESHVLHALHIEQDLHDDLRVAMRWAMLCDIYVAQGRLADAEEAIRKALQMDEDAGREAQVAKRKAQWGNVCLHKGDYVAARNLSAQAAQYLRQNNNPWSLAIALQQLGKAQFALGEKTAAAASLDECIDLCRRLDLRKQLQEVLFCKAQQTANPLLFEEAAALRDSLYNEQISTQVSELEVLYETKEIEAANAQLRTKIRFQRVGLIVAIVLLLLLVVIIILGLRSYMLSKDIQHTEQKAVEILTTSHSSFPSEAAALSERELEVVRLSCQGFLSKEIADQLSISKKTVDNHKAAIYQKLAVKNNTELLIYAIRHHLVEL